MVISMLIIVCFEDLWVNEVSISFLQHLDLKIKRLTHTWSFNQENRN